MILIKFVNNALVSELIIEVNGMSELTFMFDILFAKKQLNFFDARI